MFGSTNEKKIIYYEYIVIMKKKEIHKQNNSK